jgi:hypothetical protein
MPTLKHCELLSQSEIFQQEATTNAKETGNRAQTELEGIALMLTTEVLIADIKEDETAPVAAGHGGGMY